MSYPYLANDNQEDERLECNNDFIAFGEAYISDIEWEIISSNKKSFNITKNNSNKLDYISFKETTSNIPFNVQTEDLNIEISTHRNIEFPFMIVGPVLLSFALRNHEGKASQSSMFIEYNSIGDIIDCVFPPEKICIINDPLAPCYIIRNNEILTLPINVEQYYKIKKLVAKNSSDLTFKNNHLLQLSFPVI